MKRFHNILYVSNGVGDESQSIKQALKLAHDNNAKLSVLVACPPFPDNLNDYKTTYEQSITEQLEKTIVAARSSLKIAETTVSVKVSLLSDKALNVQIVRHVIQNSHDLLIKNAESSSSSKGFKALDMQLLRNCPCALYLSKSFKHAQKNARVAVAVDAVDDKKEARNLSVNLLELSHSMAKHYSGKLNVITCWHFVFEDYLRDSVWVKTTDEELERLLKEEKQGHLKKLESLMQEAKVSDEHQVHLLKGRPEVQIPSFINENNIDILVMGTVARTGITGFIIGNTAENILQELDCSLLALKPAGFVSPIAPY